MHTKRETDRQRAADMQASNQPTDSSNDKGNGKKNINESKTLYIF